MVVLAGATGKRPRHAQYTPPKKRPLPTAQQWHARTQQVPDQAIINNAQTRADRLYDGARNGDQPQPDWPGGGPSGGGSRGYGRGGGGGGGVDNTGAQSQIDLLMKLMNSGAMTSPTRSFTPDTAMRSQLDGAYSADSARQGQAFDQLDQYAASLGNAYDAQPQAQAARVNPDDLAALLGSQGGSDAGLRAEAQYLQGQNEQSAGAQNRYTEALRATQAGWNQSVGSEAKMSRNFAGEELGAQRRGMEAQIAASDQSRQRQIEDQNFQQQLADRQAMMQLIAQISQLSAGANLKSPDMDIEKLLGMGR